MTHHAATSCRFLLWQPKYSTSPHWDLTEDTHFYIPEIQNLGISLNPFSQKTHFITQNVSVIAYLANSQMNIYLSLKVCWNIFIWDDKACESWPQDCISSGRIFKIHRKIFQNEWFTLLGKSAPLPSPGNALNKPVFKTDIWMLKLYYTSSEVEKVSKSDCVACPQTQVRS